MTTSTNQKLFREAIFLSTWSGSTAFRWDSENVRIRLSTTSWSKVYCYSNLVIMISYEIFLIYRLLESLLIPTTGRTLSEIINLGFFICIYAIPPNLCYCSRKHSADIPMFVNGYLEYFENFKQSYMLPSQYKKKNGCETVLRIFFSTAYLTTAQNIIIFVIAPHRFYMLTSLIWDSKEVIPIVMRQLSRFYDISKKLLNSWNGMSSRMFLKSCRPLRVQVSDYYYVQKTTILVLMGVIINATITLLLSS
ncbi:unnamed protein product [Allacma fusca]|uniref:Uncharacterized protein n=1 Tax=Allacma fusca TaxID=39272 RepID=A0A8J2P1X1_9HEXA|nr:unnamed protein product [Allacma fusca]